MAYDTFSRTMLIIDHFTNAWIELCGGSILLLDISNNSAYRASSSCGILASKGIKIKNLAKISGWQ